MTTALYQEFEGDTGFKGDTNVIDGTLEVTGTTTLTGVVTLTGGIAGGTVKLVSGPSGTATSAAWTTGPPAFTSTQQYILCTAGSTTYRIPVFLNA